MDRFNVLKVIIGLFGLAALCLLEAPKNAVCGAILCIVIVHFLGEGKRILDAQEAAEREAKLQRERAERERVERAFAEVTTEPTIDNAAHLATLVGYGATTYLPKTWSDMIVPCTNRVHEIVDLIKAEDLEE